MDPIIYAVDVGSIAQGNFGWARLDPTEDEAVVDRRNRTDIVDLVEAIVLDLASGSQGVALGFECPLFVPVPSESARLGKARIGEADRSWSAAAGAGALATGLVQTAWILRELRQRCPSTAAYLDWDSFARYGTGLFLWEAFVTADAKAMSHVDDALIAATSFHDALPDPTTQNAVDAQRPLSLLSAALLWSEWSDDRGLLHEPCLVIKSTPIRADPLQPHLQPLETRRAPRSTSASRSKSPPLHERLRPIAEQIPRGAWTTYGDVAALLLIPKGALAVGLALANHVIPNAHRILNAEGKVAKNFAFPDGRTDDPMELLEAEGIRFTNGKAELSQRWQPTANA